MERGLYKSRYNKKDKNETFKEVFSKILVKVNNSRFRKVLHILDSFQLDSKNNFSSTLVDDTVENINFDCEYIIFIETIDLNKPQNLLRVFSNLIKENDFFSFRTGDKKLLEGDKQLKFKEIKDLSSISLKYSYNTNFLEIDNKRFLNKKNTDLFSTVNIGYFRTEEGLLILTFKVRPSEKFKNEFNRINEEKIIPKDKLKYFTIKDAIKQRRFISGKQANIRVKDKYYFALINDLQTQINLRFINKFNGDFFNSEKNNPYVITYSSQIDAIHENFYVEKITFNKLNKYFLHDKYNTIVSKSSNTISLLNYKSPNIDRVELHYLNYMIIPTFGLLQHVKLKKQDIDSIKKVVYEYIYSKKRTPIAEQVKLKNKLNILKIEIRNLEKDVKKNLDTYLSLDYDLHEITDMTDSTDFSTEQSNDVKYYLNSSKAAIDDLTVFFEDMHSSNVLKLNFRLQTMAIIISVIGIFTALINFPTLLNFIKILINNYFG